MWIRFTGIRWFQQMYLNGKQQVYHTPESSTKSVAFLLLSNYRGLGEITLGKTLACHISIGTWIQISKTQVEPDSFIWNLSVLRMNKSTSQSSFMCLLVCPRFRILTKWAPDKLGPWICSGLRIQSPLGFLLYLVIHFTIRHREKPGSELKVAET